MSKREAFRVFMQHQLEFAIDEGKVELSKGDMMHLIQSTEDDPIFHDRFSDFIADFIEDFGENYDLF